MRQTRKVGKNKNPQLYIGGQPTDRCIFVSFMELEGLGNQLFMYAAALTVQEKVNLPICITDGTNNPHSKRNYREIVNGNKTNININTKKRIKDADSIIPKRGSNINSWIVNTTTQGNNIKDVKVPVGLYQNYSSVIAVVPKLKKILQKNEFYKSAYMKYKNTIDSSKTAFMHVRRGDKVERGQSFDATYYSNALQKLESDPLIKTVYIVSNDKAWCDTHLDIWKKSFTKTLEYKDIHDELETLYAISLCEAGAILSSSLFGIWGAMLGADMNPKSTIVYKSVSPEYPGKTNALMFPSRWIGI
jgi:hypothetical protein